MGDIPPPPIVSSCPTHREDQIARVRASYNSGALLFPRDVLEELDRDLDEGKKTVWIKDLYGKKKEYDIKVPKPIRETSDAYVIAYRSFERLVDGRPRFSEYYPPPTPICIVYTSGNIAPSQLLSYAESIFAKHSEAWLNSSDCTSLKNTLTRYATALSNVDKVVCLGLGSMGHTSDRVTARACWQHLAALTMSELLSSFSSSSDPRHVSIYAQDPAYEDVDKEVLRKNNITVLRDPKGFLKADKNTLVFTVAPNVCVKQIITDLVRPAAMVWNTVKEEVEEKKWKWKEIIDGEGECWVSPHGTDPDSPRVRTLVKDYHQEKLQDTHGNFGDVTIYILK